MKWSDFKKKYNVLNQEAKILIAVILLSLTVIGFASYRSNATLEAESESTNTESVDTFIPKGFVLVPIDVQNYEALDSILGKFGVVDLFRTKSEGGQLIARNVRLLRAPQNPSRFAVLVAESQASQILKYQGLIFVTLKPPQQSGTEIVKTDSNSSLLKRRIIFEGE